MLPLTKEKIMEKVILTSEQVMEAREAREEGNLIKSAYIVAMATQDTMLMRILKHLEFVSKVNKGGLPADHLETFRIIVLTLKTRIKREALADWLLDYYKSDQE